MTNALPSLSPVMHEIHVEVVSQEEASYGVAELWSGDRMVGFTLIDDGDLTVRIGPSSDPMVFGAHALAEAIAEANRLLALH